MIYLKMILTRCWMGLRSLILLMLGTPCSILEYSKIWMKIEGFSSKPTIQPKRDQPVEQPKKEKPKPKTIKKDAKAKRVTQASVKEPEKKVERRGRKSSYAWTIDDELLHKDYSLEAFLKQLSSEMAFNRFAAKAVNNTVKVLLFRQKLQLLYADCPITLKEFTKLCSVDKVPVTRIDLLLGTKHLFSNIYAGSTKGIHQSEDLKILFRKAFGIELSLD